VNLPSNLVDTTDLETFTEEARIATNYDTPFNVVLGVFYAHTNRFYRQRLPTPGYDAATQRSRSRQPSGIATLSSISSRYGVLARTVFVYSSSLPK